MAEINNMISHPVNTGFNQLTTAYVPISVPYGTEIDLSESDQYYDMWSTGSFIDGRQVYYAQFNSFYPDFPIALSAYGLIAKIKVNFIFNDETSNDGERVEKNLLVGKTFQYRESSMDACVGWVQGTRAIGYEIQTGEVEVAGPRIVGCAKSGHDSSFGGIITIFFTLGDGDGDAASLKNIKITDMYALHTSIDGVSGVPNIPSTFTYRVSTTSSISAISVNHAVDKNDSDPIICTQLPITSNLTTAETVLHNDVIIAGAPAYSFYRMVNIHITAGKIIDISFQKSNGNVEYHNPVCPVGFYITYDSNFGTPSVDLCGIYDS